MQLLVLRLGIDPANLDQHSAILCRVTSRFFIFSAVYTGDYVPRD